MARLSRTDIRDILIELGSWEVVTPKVVSDIAEVYGITPNRVRLMSMKADLPFTSEKIEARRRKAAVLPTDEHIERNYESFGAEADAARAEQGRIEAAQARAADKRATLLLKRIAIATGVLLLVFASALIWRVARRQSPQIESAGPSDTYARCEARLKPKLERCLQVQPESSWGVCRAAYLEDLEQCTS